MQTFAGRFYVNEKTFALGSQILFPGLDLSSSNPDLRIVFH